MNALTKTTTNYAAARGLELTIEDGELWIWSAEDDCEPMAIYLVSDIGFNYKGRVTMSHSQTEELPAWIRDEKHLRQVVAYIAKEAA